MDCTPTSNRRRLNPARFPNLLANGAVATWIRSLEQPTQNELLLTLVMEDLALRDALPATYPASCAEPRLAILLLHKCAKDLGLDTAELVLLLDDAETQAMGLINELIEVQNEHLNDVLHELALAG